MESGRLMTQTIACKFCGAMIRHHWQLQDHATCRPPVLEQTVRAIVAPRGEEGGREQKAHRNR